MGTVSAFLGETSAEPDLAVGQEVEKPHWETWAPTLRVLLRKKHQELF